MVMMTDHRRLAPPCRHSCRVAIWQGADDMSVPVAHARWWASKLPAAELHVLPGEGHITLLLRRGGEVLAAAAAAVQTQGDQVAEPGGAAAGGAAPSDSG